MCLKQRNLQLRDNENTYKIDIQKAYEELDQVVDGGLKLQNDFYE